MSRVSAAPISWGVCEVPGWGPQLSPDQVLPRMRELGLTATELGPDGFLPDAPGDKAAVLAEHGLRAVAQFVPVVLHDPDHDPTPEIERALDGVVACGAEVLVLAAASGQDGYDLRPVLDEASWGLLLQRLDSLAAVARRRGVTATLHPHVGTVVETAPEVERVLAGSQIGICLDTGHLLIGGADPVALARAHPERIAHVHLKDVDVALAERVRGGDLGYHDAVVAGLYVPLGKGDVDLASIVNSLSGQGYSGWYVLEQDVVLAELDDVAPTTDVAVSLQHLLSLGGSA